MNTPMETAVHWVEQIAKYKGAPHLRISGIDMPFYAFYNLDCWAFIIAICSFISFIIFKIFKKIIQHFLPKTQIEMKNSKTSKTKIKSN